MKYVSSRLLLAVLIICTLYSCSVLIPDDDVITLVKVPNTSDKLKLDGYYHESDKTQVLDSYFFYSNGTLLNLGGSPKSNESDLNDLEYIFSLNLSGNDYKDRWGLYDIRGDEIRFERYYPPSFGSPLRSYIRSGKILNDSTFLITKLMRSNGTDVIEKNELYRFKKFSPKPDSTNNFL